MRNKRAHIRHAVVLILALAGLIIAAPSFSASCGVSFAQAVAPSWSYTGSLSVPRAYHIATLLPNGKVLVAGGILSCTRVSCPITDTAELYDPATGTWSVTGSLNVPRAVFSATLLLNGKVLVVGGTPGARGVFAEGTAELYDPATGRWSLTSNPHFTHWGRGLATLLADGRVLVAGGLYVNTYGNGWFQAGVSDKAEIYDPATNTWSITGSLNEARFSHTATLLQNGKVLVAGGDDYYAYAGEPEGTVLTNELYDPNTGTWSITGKLNQGRGSHTATLLPNGSVLAAGGGGVSASYDPIVNTSAELYNPATGTWNYTGSLSRRGSHTATLLPNGRVLVAGGGDGESIVGSGEVYDPATGVWSATASLNTARAAHTATLLSNGKVLVVGGVDGVDFLRTAELYDPGTGPNPIDDAEFFVRQQYLDFLGREPESGGLQFYLDILNGCQPTDIECIKYTRGALSANFFRSPEFQRKGSYVMYLYMVSLGQRPVTPAELSNASKVERPHYSEFMSDLQSISTPNDDPALTDTKKAALADAWMQRAEIQALYPAAPTMTNAQFVQKLLDTAGVTNPNESQLVTDLNNQTKTRAQVLRIIAESPEVNAKFYKQAFVTMEYFGYLRRDPEDCHNSANWTNNDPNQCGFIFHNNRFNLGFDPAQVENVIVRGFIESPEYRRRFGP